jgi:hypothetical protein
MLGNSLGSYSSYSQSFVLFANHNLVCFELCNRMPAVTGMKAPQWGSIPLVSVRQHRAIAQALRIDLTASDSVRGV